MDQDTRRYRWYATINNFTEEDIESLKSVDHRELVVGKETAPSTGTPHLHVYIALHQKKRLSQMKKICARAHWEAVQDRKRCIEYCMKDGEVVVNETCAV